MRDSIVDIKKNDEFKNLSVAAVVVVVIVFQFPPPAPCLPRERLFLNTSIVIITTRIYHSFVCLFRFVFFFSLECESTDRSIEFFIIFFKISIASIIIIIIINRRWWLWSLSFPSFLPPPFSPLSSSSSFPLTYSHLNERNDLNPFEKNFYFICFLLWFHHVVMM